MKLVKYITIAILFIGCSINSSVPEEPCKDYMYIYPENQEVCIK